ncbi:MAG: flagellar basal body P-ring formation protein FlgA [Ignavibacteriales bacterium]|nr:flagellar basal body P-ring formation protein FlgA [Ignavibacteriales bacterium]
MAFFLFSFLLFLFTGATDYDALVKGYLKNELKQYTNIEIVSIQYPAGVPEGTTKLQIDKSKPCIVNSGFAYIPIILNSSSKSVFHSVLSVKLRVFADVWVSKRPVNVSSELQAADFALENKEITKVKGDVASKNFQFDKAVAAMHINEGVILTQNMMRERPLVKYGDQLTGYITVGAAEVSLTVTARENGYAGGTIRVVSKDKKVFKAIVESGSRVKILE